ncbi:hypothetical protein ACH5RR_033256 [Cinchona calisaya]|uniref:Uncharacterized protein n=1 Tax=Cinchona calisaya TaxID=153742 RepID=A0ABD2YMN7_9GENT
MASLKKRLVVAMIITVLLVHYINFVKSESGGAMGGDSFSTSDDDSSFDIYNYEKRCKCFVGGSSTNSSKEHQDCIKGQKSKDLFSFIALILLLLCFFLICLIWDIKTSNNMERKIVLMLRIDEIKSIEEMRQNFTEISNTERAKFDVESLVNINDVVCKHQVLIPKPNQNDADGFIVLDKSFHGQRFCYDVLVMIV